MLLHNLFHLDTISLFQKFHITVPINYFKQYLFDRKSNCFIVIFIFTHLCTNKQSYNKTETCG